MPATWRNCAVSPTRKREVAGIAFFLGYTMQVMVKREQWGIGAPLEMARQLAENPRKGFHPLLVTHDGKIKTSVKQCSTSGVADAVKLLAQGKHKVAVFIDNQPVFFNGRKLHPMKDEAVNRAIDDATANGGGKLSHIYVIEG